MFEQKFEPTHIPKTRAVLANQTLFDLFIPANSELF